MDREQTKAALIEEIAGAFAEVAHPGGRENIYAVPCCPDHDALAEWLSKHKWQELAEELEVSDDDPTGYGSLLPAALHYFLPAILTFVVRNIERDPEDARWQGRAWRPLDWVYFTLVPWPRSKEWQARSKELRSQLVPRLSPPQRETVVRVLNFARAYGAFLEESRDAVRSDIETALREVWTAGTWASRRLISSG